MEQITTLLWVIFVVCYISIGFIACMIYESNNHARNEKVKYNPETRILAILIWPFLVFLYIRDGFEG